MTFGLTARKRKRNGAVVTAAATLLAAGLAQTARAQSYSFTSLADLTTTAPGGGTFTGFSAPVTSSGGGIVFKAATGTGGPVDAYYYYATPSAPGVRIIARGDAAPGVTSAPNATLNVLNAAPALDNTGNLLFSSSLTGPTAANDQGLYQYNAQTQTLTTVAIEGQAAAGGGNYASAFAFRGGAATGGNITFTTTATGGVNVLYSGTASNVVRVLANGDAAPNAGTFSTFANPNVDAAGRITFSGTTTGNPTTNIGIFAAGGGQPTVRLVGGGDPATVPSLTNAAFANPIVLPFSNAGGLTVFRSNVVGTVSGGGTATLNGVFTLSGGAPTCIAFEGQPAPGGGTYGSSLTTIRLTDNGLSAFRASLSGTTGNAGIFAFSASNPSSVQRVLAIGDPLFGSTVTSVGTPAITESGLLVFEYTLADARTGVLTAAVAVPEPGTLALFSVAGLPLVGAVALRRRRANG